MLQHSLYPGSFRIRKLPGYFFVYRKFAVAECDEAMKAPAGLFRVNRRVCREKRKVLT